MSKTFVSFNEVRNNALKLAHKIHEDGFIPDVIYVSLRGGAYLGNVISEYFKIIRADERPVFYAAVVAHSYSDIHTQDSIRVDGWTYSPEHLRKGDKILFIDDIFDSGRTINYLVQIIVEKGIPREDIKIAVHDYKLKNFLPEKLPIHPDYYCKKHVLNTVEEDIWIHYMSHELVGLSQNEISDNYLGDDQELRAVFKRLYPS
jgi:uncharacterized protein